MAPARMSTRRTQHDQNASTRSADPDTNDGVVNEELFLEPMMGTPLAMYVEKDVQDRDALVDIIMVSSVASASSDVSFARSNSQFHGHCAITRFQVILDDVLISL
jgi:hypothetical protein